MKVVFYMRDAEDTSVQKRHLLEYAMENGHQVLKSYSDVGVGLGMDRPGLNKLLSEVGGMDCDAVVAASADCLAPGMVAKYHLAVRLERLSLTAIILSGSAFPSRKALEDRVEHLFDSVGTE